MNESEKFIVKILLGGLLIGAGSKLVRESFNNARLINEKK